MSQSLSHAAKPSTKRLVLIGGGHAHVSVIKQFGKRPIAGVQLIVISRDLMAPYSGMLPGYIAGHYSLEECHIDLVPLCEFAKANLIHTAVTGLNVDKKIIQCANGEEVPYDFLSINIGSSPDVNSIQGAADNVVPVKPISNFVDRWQQLFNRVLSKTGEINIGVVGGGAGGIELCLAMQYRLNSELKRQGNNNLKLCFHLFDSNTEVLSGHNRKVRKKFKQVLQQRKIVTHLGQRVVEVEKNQLRTEDNTIVELEEIIWVTRASAQSWLQTTALVLTPDGFISVDPNLQSVSHPNVFAVGDIAHVIAHPRPKAGVFAVRQGLPLARNLRRAISNKPLIDFRPQLEFLSLISTGDKYAVASKSSWMMAGKWMWRWKNWIDKQFMQKFTILPNSK